MPSVPIVASTTETPRAAWYVPVSTHPAAATWLSSTDSGGRARVEQSRAPLPNTGCGNPSAGVGGSGTPAPGVFQFESGRSNQAPGAVAEGNGLALGGSMLLPVQVTMPCEPRAQCSEPLVNVGVFVLLRQKASPVVVR